MLYLADVPSGKPEWALASIIAILTLWDRHEFPYARESIVRSTGTNLHFLDLNMQVSLFKRLLNMIRNLIVQLVCMHALACICRTSLCVTFLAKESVRRVQKLLMGTDVASLLEEVRIKNDIHSVTSKILFREDLTISLVESCFQLSLPLSEQKTSSKESRVIGVLAYGTGYGALKWTEPALEVMEVCKPCVKWDHESRTYALDCYFKLLARLCHIYDTKGGVKRVKDGAFQYQILNETGLQILQREVVRAWNYNLSGSCEKLHVSKDVFPALIRLIEYGTIAYQANLLAWIRPFKYVLKDPDMYCTILEVAGNVDMSLGIKMGVHFSPWGGSVLNLGTKKHRDKYYDGIDNMRCPGCFAMTELHHGSNIQGIQTLATFDPLTDTFIIDSPNDGAIKWWMGNIAIHGKFATIFSKLMLLTHEAKGFTDRDLHVFIVPINEEQGDTFPGVEIHDCGHKVGLNGVDNGALRLSFVRISRDNPLNRFRDVPRERNYMSSLPSINQILVATLGELVGGRVGLTYASVGVLKIIVIIVVHYSLPRQQFGPQKQPEINILDYQFQQHKLMLASTYVFHFATSYLLEKYSEKSHDKKILGDMHAPSAGLKAYVTSHTARSLSVCRESCGGHWYVVVYGPLRNDHNIFQPFEGDNTILLQQVVADLFKQYQKNFQGGTKWLVLCCLLLLEQLKNSIRLCFQSLILEDKDCMKRRALSQPGKHSEESENESQIRMVLERVEL